jgi:hypothetical protein
MARKIPRVSEQWLYDPHSPPGEIRLDSAAWFEWLEAATSVSFSYPLFDPACGYIVGFMTVRKERKQRGYQYWSGYRRQNGRLRKRYVGPSRQVTKARLETIAEGFRQEGADERAAAEVARKEEEAVQLQEPPPSPQSSTEKGRVLILDVTRKEPRNMDNAVWHQCSAVRISKGRIVGYDAGRYTTGWNA